MAIETSREKWRLQPGAPVDNSLNNVLVSVKRAPVGNGPRKSSDCSLY